MRFTTATAALSVVLMASTTVEAFNVQSSKPSFAARNAFSSTQPSRTKNVALQARLSPLYSIHSPAEQTVADEEIEKLKSMAQQLRAEAARLEAERAGELAEAAEKVFRKFDTNNDGEISFSELKAGLEKTLKTELPEKRVQKLLDDFDASGDGKLQLDEFVTLDKFKNKLQALAREEREQALAATKAAKQEEELVKLTEARAEMFNDRPPSNTDKLVSVLPYLFPLLDGLQFGQYLILANQDNPLAIAYTLIYALYRSIPFSGFAAFLVLNFLSSNVGINRLVRFNMQQAIFLDIALFFPGLLTAVIGLIGSGAGVQVPPGVAETGSTAIFITLLATLAYCSASSLLGIAPNKLPLISQAVEDRMPTVDMFDDQGRFIPKDMREKKDDDENNKKD